jgi:citrate lyase subunit beta/citryl-CoA lyase
MASSACDTLPIRSLLFVPGDSERKLERALDAGADALILDLEDSVAPSRKAAARALVAAFLKGHSQATAMLWVRINPPSTPLVQDDLAGIVACRPRGLVVPKVQASELGPLGAELERLELDAGLEAGTTQLLPIATETPASLFSLGDYPAASSRLAGLTWGAEDLSVALGASATVGDDGRWLFTFELARSLCLAAAHAADIAAIDTVYTHFRDAEGLRRQAAEARRDGFTGKLAIHPDQVAVINEAFQPSRAEIDAAQRIVAVFDHAAATAGTVAHEGRMLDRPHLLRARRVLALAARVNLP